MCLGPGIAGGAQLLSDDDLDQVTAAGVIIDIFPASVGTLDPLIRISFDYGNTRGSADIIPLGTRGGPVQPIIDLDGAAIVSGGLPFTLIAETLMMNFNICYNCVAETIIQTNNGFVIPIYAQ